MSAPAEQTTLSQRNFYLGIVNGPVTMVATVLMNTETLLAAFVVKLMGGNVVWVGLLASIIACATLLPQIYLAAQIETSPRRLPFYRWGSLIRTLPRMALAFVLLFAPALPRLYLFAILAASMLTWALGLGASLIPFWSVVGDSIPAHWRGRFFGWRNVIGGLLAVAAGLWIKHMLSPQSGYVFPRNYGILALAAALAEGIGTGVFCLAHERPPAYQKRRLPLSWQLRRGPRLFRRDPNYRRLLRANISYSLAMSCVVPFIVPYALKHSGVALAALGAFIIARQLAFSVLALVWGRISDQAGNRRLMVITSCLVLLVPLAMLAAPQLSPGAPVTYFAVVFALVGASTGGLEMGSGNYLLEVAPPRKRSTYLGFTSAIGLPLAWAPFLASLLIGGHDRFLLGFAVSLAAALFCVYNVLRLSEVREEANGEGATE